MAGSAKVDIIVDISKLKDAVAQAQSEIASLKINGSQVTIGGKRINADLDTTRNKTEQLDKSVKKLTKDAKQANAAAQQATKAANESINKQAQQAASTVRSMKAITSVGTTIKTFIQGMITPWTLLIIAVEGAIKTFKYFFNNTTENIEKIRAKGESAIKAAQVQIQKTEQRAKSVSDLLKKLEDLNKAETLSDDQKQLGAAIIQRLNKEYKIFGITLDDVTNKYEGLYQAKMKADAAARAAEAEQIQKQIQGQRKLINASLKEILGSGLELGKSIDGKDLFTFAERYNKTLGSQMRDQLARQWGGGKDLYAIRDVLQRLMDGLSTRQNKADIQKIIDEINELINYTEKLDNLNSASKAAVESAQRLSNSFEDQRKAIKSVREEIERLNQQYQKGQEQDAFNALAPKEQVKALQDEIKALEERNKVVEEAKTKSQQLNAQKQKEATSAKQQITLDQSQQQQLQTDIAKRTAQNAELEQRIIEHNQKFERQRRDWQTEYDIVNKRIEGGQRYKGGSYKASDKDYARRAELAGYLEQVDAPVKQWRGTIDANKKSIEEAKAKINELNASIAKAETQAKTLGDDALNAEQQSVEAEKERIQNLNDIADKKRQIAELNKQIAEEQARAAQEAEKAAQQEREADRRMMQRQLNANETLNDIAVKANIELLRKQGKELEANALERESIVKSLTKQIESQLGRPLTEKEQGLRESIEASADIQMALRGINTERPNIQSDQVYSNELARMGGFSSSIVVDRMDINKEILNVNKQANNNLNTIANSVQKIYDNTTL